MILRAGQLNRKITFQEETSVSQDAHGQPSGSWTDISTDSTVWCQFLPAGGEEEETQDRKQYIQKATFRIRHRTDLDAQMRIILDDSTAWDITGIADPDGRREQLEIQGVHING